ncbi:3'-5' exonuclease [bacterium]|nr:3'-5' exonuclease [bacterium]
MKMIKLFLDTETTGLSADKQDVIQIGAISESGEQFEGKCQPHRWDTIAQQALDVHGYQYEDLRKFQDPSDLLIKFVEFLEEHTPVDEDFRIQIVAHNASFDYRFMKAWWEKCGLSTWDDVFCTKDEVICTQKLARDAKKAGLLDVENVKLVTVASHLGIEFDAHDALGDTIACKGIYDYFFPNGDDDAVSTGGQSDEELAEDGRKPVEEYKPDTAGKMVL